MGFIAMKFTTILEIFLVHFLQLRKIRKSKEIVGSEVFCRKPLNGF